MGDFLIGLSIGIGIVLMLAWFTFLPAVGVLYMIGYLS